MNGAAIASDNISNKRRSSLDGESAELIKSLRAIGKKEYPCADNMDAFQKLAALSTDNAMQANQINSLEVENDALKSQISGLSKEQRALAKTGFEAALKHDAEVKDIETKTAKWRARETMLLEQIKGLKTELKALKNEGKRIEKERRASTKMEASGSQDLIEELKATNRKSEATVATLNEQMHAVRLELDGLSSKLVYESEKAGHLQGQVDLLTAERQDLLEERDTLLQEVKHFELLIKEKIQEAFEEEHDEAAESAQCVPVKKDQSCSPMKLSMASNRESFFLGLVSGNSLAGELASVNGGGEAEVGGDHSALVSENEALKDEIVGLTMYINKLIQQVDLSDAEALVENQPRIGANDGANTIRRKLLSSIRKFSGSKGALNPSQSLIYDHREWMNKHGSMDDAPEFIKESAKEAQLTKCPSNESEFSNVTAGSGVDLKPASVTAHNKKEGVLSSIKSLGSWMVGSTGTSSITATPAKTLNEQEPVNHAKLEEKTEKRRSTAGNSKILLSELLEKQRAEDGDILEFKEVKRLEKALAKVGYRQSRILENKRAVVRLKE
ncbi:hypothetical protein HDU77_004355 [Chytriomyces hyalinus]|nr:hypothetical protein HDU77_004355 [Chytriomyces hyalinus]